MSLKFFERCKTPLVSMVSADNTSDAICEILNGLYDGADAFGIQMCRIKEEYRSDSELSKIFAACEGKPIYITSYKAAESKDYTYDQCVELLLKGLKCARKYGAVLCDVMADTYGEERNGMSFDPGVVAKQIKLIDLIHERGGEVLMSCHNKEFLGEDEFVKYIGDQFARGADVAKLVTRSESEDQMHENLRAITRIKNEFGKPFLYLSGGSHQRLIRQLGPAFGVCMYLCIPHYTPASTKMQVHLRTAKAIRDGLLL